MNDEPYTTINVHGGGLIELSSAKSSVKSARINPNNPSPIGQRDWYRIPHYIMGKIETLARGRFEISEYTGESSNQLELWDQSNPKHVESVVRMANASSTIEGEGFSASDVPKIVHAVTKSLGQKTEELSDRVRAAKDIADTYFFALNRTEMPVVSVDFIRDLHRRMFQTSKPGIAGKFKDLPVYIADEDRMHYDVETLPPEKVELFMSNLCTRYNRAYQDVDRSPKYCRLILIAEFIVDFLAIHPFSDGNGRTARLLSTYLLNANRYQFGKIYSLDQIVLDTKIEYYDALFYSQSRWYQSDEDLTPWITYYINAIFKQWERAFAEVRDRAMAKLSASTSY